MFYNTLCPYTQCLIYVIFLSFRNNLCRKVFVWCVEIYIFASSKKIETLV